MLLPWLFPSTPISCTWVDQFIPITRQDGYRVRTQALVKGCYCGGRNGPISNHGLWYNVQGPAYNRHTLPGETEPTEHAKEILILRRRSLWLEVTGGDTASSRKEVRGEQERLGLRRLCTGCFPRVGITA